VYRVRILIAISLLTGVTLRAQEKAVRFEVASVKRNTSDVQGSCGPRPGRLRCVNQPLLRYISDAYGVPAYLIVNMAAWVTNERFDIEGTMPSGTRLVLAVQPNGALRYEPAVLATLLEERFALRSHWEKREIATYDLTLARDDGQFGPGLRRDNKDCTPPPNEMSPCRFSFGMNLHKATGLQWDAMLISVLSNALRKPVIDRTGLQGQFTVDLTWSNDLMPTADPGEKVSIFTAVREQLGLTLQPSRTAVDVFVVDQIERPTEN